MIKAVIFDCFGVLVGRGYAETYRLAGGDPFADREFIEDMLGQSNLGSISEDEFREQITTKLGITLDDYDRAEREAEQPNHELLDYIETLRPKYKTAILSNASVGSLEQKLPQGVLREYFDAVVVSAEVGMVKPDPDIYKLTVEKLGVEATECVFVDDRQPYCDAANPVGIKAILYKDMAHFKADLEKILG